MKYPKLALLGGLIILASPITHAFPDDGYSRPYQPITPAPVFIQGPPDQANMLVRQLSNSKNNTYILPAIPSTTNWGYFDAGAPPALSIKSGDTVMIEPSQRVVDKLPLELLRHKLTQSIMTQCFLVAVRIP